MYLKSLWIGLCCFSVYPQPIESEHFIPVPQASVVISGKLEIPNNMDSFILILPGSGPDKRSAHSKLAKKLLAADIGVFRFDDRGVGNSTGTFTRGAQGLDTELLAIADYLKKQKQLKGKKMGIWAHSLGGIVLLNALKKENLADFYVFMACPATNMAEALAYQADQSGIRTAFRFGGRGDSKRKRAKHVLAINKIIAENTQDSIIEFKAKQYLKKNRLKHMMPPFYWNWYRQLLREDIEDEYAKLKQPFLVLLGEKDDKIDSHRVLAKIEALEHPLASCYLFDELNHYLKKGKLGKEAYQIDDKVVETAIRWMRSFIGHAQE
ncbi:MAG: alpha/beta hydrolase [Flavobacteriaceae bacterium]|nr:alpha/beta hydrolase [Flavobacteriaceae bacterium]